MRLFEHPDFEQAIIRAAEHFRPRGLREAIIEKDDFVTEALRIIEHAAGPQVIFKGGTSLSKGWGLIQRFSEDIDIFLDPTAFEPPLGKKGIDRELKKLRQAIEQHPALTFVEKESQTIITTSSAWSNARRSWPCSAPTSTLLSRPTTTGSAPLISRSATCRRPR